MDIDNDGLKIIKRFITNANQVNPNKFTTNVNISLPSYFSQVHQILPGLESRCLEWTGDEICIIELSNLINLSDTHTEIQLTMQPATAQL